MNSDKLLDLAWAIAEIEARALGSEVIEPMHFLLAALKIVDVDFAQAHLGGIVSRAAVLRAFSQDCFVGNHGCVKF